MEYSTSRCIAMAGYFDNSTQVCVKCGENCSTCKSSTVCVSCKDKLYLGADGRCSDSCPPRYYANPALFICQNCPYDCYLCNQEGKCTSCDDKIDNRVLDEATLRCVAIEGYFQVVSAVQSRLLYVGAVNINLIALKCSDGCRSCYSGTICRSCKRGYYLRATGNKSLCDQKCPNRYYTNQQTISCDPCPYDCFTCDIEGNCLTCSTKDHRRLFDITERCLCLPRYYDNGTSGCLQCDLTCTMCLN